MRHKKRFLSDSLGASPALGGDAGLSESDARVLPIQRDETTSERWRDWKSHFRPSCARMMGIDQCTNITFSA